MTRSFFPACALAVMLATSSAAAHTPTTCDHTLALTVRLAEGKAKVAGWLLNEINTSRDTEAIISLMGTYFDTDTLFMETSEELIECLGRADEPTGTAALVDLDWLDDVISDLDEPPEPPAARVELGVECTEPFTVSLSDNLLTECEME